MGAAQLDRGQLLVVLGVGGVVVADQGAAVAGQDAEGVQLGVTAVVGGPEPDQLAGAGGVDVEQPVAVIAGDPGRGFVVVHHRRGPQPLLQRGLEFRQAGGDPVDQAAGEAGRDRRVEQHAHQVSGALDTHMPVAGQQRRRRPHVRAVTARPGQPRRGGRPGHRPAGRAGHLGHLVLGDLQLHRRGVEHLDPRGHPPLQAGQVMPAPRTLAGRHHGDPVRVTAPGQRATLMARLAAARTRRALPRLLGASGPRRRPVRTRRHRGVGRVHPHPPLQLLDLSQQRRDHRIPLRQGSQQLLTAELPGIGHPPKLRISRHSSHDHRNRRVYLKSDTGNRPEWILKFLYAERCRIRGPWCRAV